MPGSLLLLLACVGAKDDTAAVDADGDGYGSSADCDDGDPSVFPGAAETCDGRDEDCDGQRDEDAIDAAPWYADGDGDGYGATSLEASCEAASGAVAEPGDCDDTDPAVNPAAREVCNGVDDDCTGTVDDDAEDATFAYGDADGDGYGDPAEGSWACEGASTRVADDTDCDDTDPNVNPSRIEACNEVDDDCDGEIDEDAARDASTWYTDDDGDGYGDPASARVACDSVDSEVGDGTDCDDTDATVSPVGTEVCGGGDEDCDGEVDEDTAADAGTWYADADADGYGDASSTAAACEPPSGYLSDATDCDDANAASNPAGTEVCGGGDEDCDGTVDEDEAADAPTWYTDADGDGYGDAAFAAVHCAAAAGTVGDETDCDDADASVNPGAAEVCRNGVDDDCDGAATGCTLTSASVEDADAMFVGSRYLDGMGGVIGRLGDMDGDGCDEFVSVGYPRTAYIYGGCALHGTYGMADATATITTPYSGPDLGQGGDVDGDGYADMFLDLGAYSGALHAVAVYRGPLSGAYADADADAQITLEEEEQRVSSMSVVADVDGDGLEDLLVGSESSGTGGRAYLVYGASLTTSSLSDADAIYESEAMLDGAGYGVAGAGDTNGDGYGDLWIAARTTYGTAYLVLGPAGVDLGLGSADAVIVGDAAESLGGALGEMDFGVGDVNADGLSDVLLRQRNIGVRLGLGPFSGTTALSAAGTLLQGDASDGAVYDTAMSDVNADGAADILVSTEAGPWGSHDGTVYLFTTAPSADALLSDAEARIEGDIGANATELVDPGDVNGDGHGDILIGAAMSGAGGVTESGATFLFYGTGL